MDDENGRRELLKWVTNVAAVSLWAPGLLILLGTLRVRHRFVQVGLGADPPRLPLNAIAAEGLQPVGLVVVAFTLIYILLWFVLCWQQRSWVPLPPLHQIPFLAWLAAAGVLILFVSLSWIGDGTRRVLPGLTILDLGITFVGAYLVVAIVQLSVTRRLLSRILVGHSVPGIAISGMVIVMSLSASAALQGADEGNDIVWRCVGQTGVLLETEAPHVDNNTTFQLLHRGGGFFYLRDADRPGLREVILVPDSLVVEARYVALPALQC